MRTHALALSVVLGAVGLIPAEEPAAPGLRPGQGRPQVILDHYLRKWDERNAGRTGVASTCRLTEIEDFGRKEVFVGELTVLRPNYANLLLKPESDPDRERKWRHLVMDGDNWWILDHGQKVAQNGSAPPPWVHAFFGFLTVPKADDLKTWLEMSIDPDDKNRFNDFYLHIDVKPKTKEAERWFRKGEVVLWKSEDDPRCKQRFMLPARIWAQTANHDQILLEFSGWTAKELTKDDFGLLKLGDDWKVMDRPKLPKPTAKDAAK